MTEGARDTKIEETTEDKLKRLEQAEFERDVAKSRLTTLQHYVDQRDEVAGNHGATHARIIHQEGIIMRQRIALKQMSEALYRRKQRAKKLTAQLAELRKQVQDDNLVIGRVADADIPVAQVG